MFFTLEDPRARIKGSRDPLGVLPVWSSFGRRAVVNLTTVTTSVRGFTVLVLGHYWIERLIAAGRLREEDALSAFLRWEQLAAYGRWRTGEGGRVLGISRVDGFAARGRVTIDDGPDGRILSDQKTYGLWGLYTVSSRTSGLVKAEGVGVTGEAATHLETVVVPRLDSMARKLDELVVRGGTVDVNAKKGPVPALAEVLTEELQDVEREFYARYLRDAEGVVGGEVPGERQAMLARLYRELDETCEEFGWVELDGLTRAARDADPALARALERIGALEAFIAPIERLYGFLQGSNGRTPQEVATELDERWPDGVPRLDVAALGELGTEIETVVGPELRGAMMLTAGAVADRDWRAAVECLLTWNKIVMEARGGAPWVRLGDNGKLDVRYRGLSTYLPTQAELADLWRNSYFVDALKGICAQLEGAA